MVFSSGVVLSKIKIGGDDNIFFFRGRTHNFSCNRFGKNPGGGCHQLNLDIVYDALKDKVSIRRKNKFHGDNGTLMGHLGDIKYNPAFFEIFHSMKERHSAFHAKERVNVSFGVQLPAIKSVNIIGRDIAAACDDQPVIIITFLFRLNPAFIRIDAHDFVQYIIDPFGDEAPTLGFVQSWAV